MKVISHSWNQYRAQSTYLMKTLSPLTIKLYSSHVTAPFKLFDTDNAWHKVAKATTSFSSARSLILAKHVYRDFVN